MADLKYTVDVDTKGAQRALGGLKTAIVAIGAGILTKEIIDVTARFEDLRTSLNTVTKSVQAGGQAFDFISKFATQTQFGIEDLSKTFIQLKAAGIEPTQKLLKTFTDTAAVTTDQLGSLEAITALLSRTTGGGLGLEELERLADRGIPVYRILREEIGLTRDQISEFGKTSEGARIIVENLLAGLDKEFGGATEARLNNLSTIISNFKISVANLANEFGTGLAPAIKELTIGLTDFIEQNKGIAQVIGRGLGDAILFLKDQIAGLLETTGLLKAGGVENLAADITDALASFIDGFGKSIDSIVNTVLEAVQSLQRIIVAISSFTSDFDAVFLDVGQSSEDFKNKLISDLDELKERQANFTFAERAGGMFGGGLAVATSREIKKIEAQLQSLADGTLVVFESSRANFTGASEAVQPFADSLRETAAELREAAAQATTSTQVFDDYDDAILRAARAQEAANAATAEARRLQDALNVSISAYNTEADQRIANAEQSADLSAFQGLQRTLEEIRLEEQRLGEAAKTRIEEQFSAADPEILREQLANIDAVTQRTIEARQEAARQIDLNAQKFKDAEQAKIDAAKAAEEAARNAQKSFAEGWKDAFESYKKSAMDSGRQAERLFNKTTKSMEDAIVGFAKTGKFEFKDLINTILEELLRSQVQRLIAQTFGSFGGGGGGGGFNPFAGFFANGGLIPAGQFGVVGERGPELISGPANITPMDRVGGGTQVVYNINAVDAPSFKSMIARDPGFIHAVAQQGARKVPVRR